MNFFKMQSMVTVLSIHLWVADDWSFADVMDDLGCTVFAFDGSVDYSERRGSAIHFEKVWVCYETVLSENQKSFETLLSNNGHKNKKISYLKIEIEGN